MQVKQLTFLLHDWMLLVTKQPIGIITGELKWKNPVFIQISNLKQSNLNKFEDL